MAGASRKPVIGLVGGIGSGKSRVAAELAALGGFVVDGDRLGHEALRQPEILSAVVQRFGPEILDDSGQVVRKKLASLVFGDERARRDLEALVFPWIGRRVREEFTKAEADAAAKFLVLDAAVMLEAGWNDVCERLIFVEAPRAVRLRRLAEQRGWTEDDVLARERVQLPLEEKRRRADAVLVNDGTVEAMASDLRRILHAWRVIS